MASKLAYIFIFTLLAGSISSCTSDEAGDLDTDKKAVEFDVSSDTRASVTTTSDINSEGSRFVVFGDLKPRDTDMKDPLVFMNNTIVEYRNGNWNYEGIHYWAPYFEHSFIAIHPASVVEVSDHAYSGSRLSFNYEIPTAEGNSVKKDDITDIISATHRRLYVHGDEAHTVSFRFGHLLSLINLSAAFDDNTLGATDFIEFHKLELSGFSTKATFNLLPSPLQLNNQTDDREISVSGQDGSGNLTVEFATPVKIGNNREYTGFFADNDAILMLPQSFEAASEAKFILSYTASNEPTRMKQATLPLRNMNWAVGNRYSYRFTITRTGIVIDNTDITDWDKLDAGNVDVH